MEPMTSDKTNAALIANQVCSFMIESVKSTRRLHATPGPKRPSAEAHQTTCYAGNLQCRVQTHLFSVAPKCIYCISRRGCFANVPADVVKRPTRKSELYQANVGLNCRHQEAKGHLSTLHYAALTRENQVLSKPRILLEELLCNPSLSHTD